MTLQVLYQQMADLTAPECANTCRAPHSCCDPMYCEFAEEYAAEKGIELTRTDHPTLRFMGPGGCTVPPHLRPLCTLHTCQISSFGCKPTDAAWTKKYFRLRAQIDKLELA